MSSLHHPLQIHFRMPYRIPCVTYIVFIFLLCSNVVPAYAGRGGQGPSLDGHESPRSVGQECSAANCIGARDTAQMFTGRESTTLVRPLAITGPNLSGQLDNDTRITVESFRGDVVVATVQDAATGTSKRVRRHPRELIGFRWVTQACDQTDSCVRVAHRVASVVVDSSRNTMPAHASNSDVWLYRVERAPSPDADDGDWVDVCARADGTADGGLFVDGQWRTDGSRQAGGYTFSCNRGAIAKCIRTFGYKPWKSLRGATGRSVALEPLHEACVRAVRADYRGDGVSHTREGVMVEIFDRYGFNVRTPDGGFTAEASFDRDGAVSFHRPRVPARSRGLRWSARSPGTPLLHVWSEPARKILTGDGWSAQLHK